MKTQRAVETAGPVDKLKGELAHRSLDNPSGCPQSPQPRRRFFDQDFRKEERKKWAARNVNPMGKCSCR